MFTSVCFVTGVNDAVAFQDLCLALTVLGFDQSLIDGLFGLVSAVLHIGNLVFESSADGESVSLTSADHITVGKIATLLGVCTCLAACFMCLGISRFLLVSHR